MSHEAVTKVTEVEIGGVGFFIDMGSFSMNRVTAAGQEIER